MKKTFPLLVIILLIAACDAFDVPSQPVVLPWTAAPSRTPNIVTATPIILTLPFTQTFIPSVTTAAPVTITNTPIPPPTSTITPVPPTATPTITSTFTASPTPTPVQSVTVDILGCNTSIDITHGMGEVTNAFVTVKNTGTVDLPNTCALLRAIDEDREHPNKKVCVPSLPVRSQVTLKLTVDSAYQQNTAIQVDATSNEVILLRVDKPSCADIGLFGGAPSDLGVVKPMQ